MLERRVIEANGRRYLVRFKPAPTRRSPARVAVQVIHCLGAAPGCTGGRLDRPTEPMPTGIMQTPNCAAYWTQEILDRLTVQGD